MQLYDERGKRLFINAEERARFIASADLAEPLVRTFCHLLVFTGCRITEALSLTASNIQVSDRVISVTSLKKRNRLVVREIPIPPELLILLDDIHDLFHLTHTGDAVAQMQPLWPWSRSTAWRRVKEVMNDADIYGAQATAKGLRHGYGRHAVVRGIQLHLLQKWMGHSDIKTTTIYANTTSQEEHQIAQKMW